MADSQDNTVRFVPFFARELDEIRDILYAIFKLDGGNMISCRILRSAIERHVDLANKSPFICQADKLSDLEETRKSPADVDDGDNGMTMVSFVCYDVLERLNDLASSIGWLEIHPEGRREYSIRILHSEYYAIVRDFILNANYMYPNDALDKFWKTAVKKTDKGKDGES